MFHSKRVWSVSLVESKESLAEMFAKHSSFVLCTGFKLGNLLFLNDSSSEEGFTEFAVVRLNEDGTMTQIESVTFSWCDYAEALEYITEFLEGRSYQPRKVHPQIDQTSNHSCHLCA